MNDLSRFITIDEDGFFVFDGQKLEDQAYGARLLNSIKRVEVDRFIVELDGQLAWVEAFDAPFVARHVERRGSQWFLIMPYEVERAFSISALTLDEWDRFHGHVEGGIPFVFSRNAQFDFFNALDSYDDSSIEVDGESIEISDWLSEDRVIEPGDYWNNRYVTEKVPWDMGEATPILKSILPQIKLPKSRVLVLGCGSGNDAAYFADQGHVVTAVDISPEALKIAKDRHSSALVNWVQADVFNLPAQLKGQFDLVFEHTLYCAINPKKRNDLVNVWKNAVHAQGQLLGIFFVMDKLTGPPIGGSEWEVRRRLQKTFQMLYWTRWHHSVPERQSKELVVLGRRLS